MTEKLNLVSKETILKIKNTDVKSELADLDYKEIFSISDTKAKIEFSKDMLAFANSKGGYIIFGVNNSFEWIGLDDRSDSDTDEANISNILDNYVDGHLDFITNTVEIDGLHFFIVYIFKTKDITPFKKDGQYSKTAWKQTKSKNITVFKKGDIYCRRGSRSIKADNLFFKLKSNDFKVIENISSLPVMYNEFVGRVGYLEELDLKLNNKNNRLIQIDGIGGIGKTTFVHYFCTKLIENEKFKNNFDFIIWTSSKRNKYTPQGIKDITEFISNYTDLLEDIYNYICDNGLEEAENELLEIEEIVLNFLKNNKVLLIVDNLETLNDKDLISFLEHFPLKSKAILTTRETLGDFYMSRINLNGFKEENEFPNFLNSQYRHFCGNDKASYTELYSEYTKELYKYTKGMPLAGQLISHQLSTGTPIDSVIENLKNGKAYEDILRFCFKGSIDKLSKVEQTLLFVFSLSEKEELLSLDDLIYISTFTSDEIGLTSIPKLSKISLCLKQKKDNGEIGYSIPHLAKIYSKQYLTLDNEQEIIANYENFINEKNKFNNEKSESLNLFYRSKAKNHSEKVAATDALKALSIAYYNYDSAINTIERLIRENSKFAFLYLIKGKIEENGIYKDSYERAKKEFLLAVDIDDDFIEALIELGYLEYKSRIGNREKAKKIIHSSVSFFSKALKLNPEDERIHLGLAQCYSVLATKTSFTQFKQKRIELGVTANEHFDKSIYQGEDLSKTEIHSNAIAYFGKAINIRNNARDDEKAIETCKIGLEYEPENKKILELKEQLEFKLNPNNYAQKVFSEKGWIK
ncbi:putative DNA binding domain-containing protein [Tenacibaculum finnmarkense genomovar finnmarkense]|uniref:ATP-binding protein n=1 Tax=Tenacibaculum finnmarkense TaxID=2781243 RepID=UPI001E301F25|nr:ATP-binding protein [Tenacibaculum finnmarkense]MCD8418755.1 putative DNA binding domain-containing protein [Tenacibaculum finnmarkense genomovar finnmarkense]MCG8187056.1 putative DNA binding domain-containing protein [Tenacibaculum finnmarkense genomovar finnmarkense]MCG8203603.1 putative DNA binding domain-containing protein [Tenacibaculum finnmarkense genomovar finnmarkense]MCG8211090.1 putative DNA binding domain-containing protein [Tenacibaculum finnmarkense genomovar finnmarkense]MCG